MGRRGGALLAVALVTLGAGPTPATATADEPPRVLAAANDRPHDAVLTNDKGISTAARRSIEVKRLVVTDRGHQVRFTMRVRRVARTTAFTQLYFIDIATPDLPWGQMQVATHSRTEPEDQHGIEHDMVIEGTGNPQGYVACNHLRVSLRDGARRWWVEVPRRCLPRGPAEIEVYAQTVEGPGERPLGWKPKQYSHDTLVVPGQHDLGGRAQASSDSRTHSDPSSHTW